MILDGYTWGLGASVWALGAILGVVTAVGPWALGCWLTARAVHRLRQTRAAWWLRARRAVRRLRRVRG